MAILRSSDGKFYDVADDQLEDKLIPAEEIKERLGDVGVGPASGPVGAGPNSMSVPGTGGQVVIQVYTSAEGGGGGMGGPPPEGEGEAEGGDVEAHGYCGWRRNCFSNSWRRNCWRNSCY
tara:strand:+ start:2417 stop:2776 length:360 start_codon:yes stop_codon:yes gene_type:complete